MKINFGMAKRIRKKNIMKILSLRICIIKDLIRQQEIKGQIMPKQGGI